MTSTLINKFVFVTEREIMGVSEKRDRDRDRESEREIETETEKKERERYIENGNSN